MEATGPGTSLATIVVEDGAIGVYAEGDELMEGVEILAIETGVVHLLAGNRRELLRLSSPEDPKKPKKPAAPATKKKPPKKGKNELDGARDAISCKGLSCTVDRAFVNKLVASPAMLMKQGRAMPYSRTGLKGFRLSGVFKGTLPNLLGLKTGDVITSINGQSLESIDGATQMYMSLRTASALSVEFTRSKGGERQENKLEVEIQ
jgi:general secretion pathway protein C